jgi:hypothetical protein
MPQEQISEAQQVSQIIGSNSILDGTSSAIDLPGGAIIAQPVVQTAQPASPNVRLTRIFKFSNW